MRLPWMRALCVTCGMGNVAGRVERRGSGAGRQRLTRAQRRDQLLDAAAELVAERGIGAVTMEGVAARAGVSKALPYTHFDDATDLLVSLRLREMEVLGESVKRAVVGVEGFEAQVHAVVHATFGTAVERGGILTTLVFALPIANEPAAAVGPEPSDMAVFFVDQLGVSLPVARVMASVVILGFTGALLSLSASLASRPLVEAVVTRMILGGVSAVATAELDGQLPS